MHRINTSIYRHMEHIKNKSQVAFDQLYESFVKMSRKYRHNNDKDGKVTMT